MKTLYTYTLACLALEGGTICAALVVYFGPYTDAQRIGAILAPGALSMVLWAAGALAPWVRRLRVEAQLRRAERDLCPKTRRLQAIEAELRAARRARARAWWGAVGASWGDAESYHERDMIARVARLEGERLDAIGEAHE